MTPCPNCGLSYNEDLRWGECPHPILHDVDAVKQIMKFSERNKTEFPLVLGLNYQDPERVLGRLQLSARGRAFFNNRDPLPLSLTMGAFQVGEVLIPVEFAITHPPLDPVFGDVKR
jgi:hypothetical protein